MLAAMTARASWRAFLELPQKVVAVHGHGINGDKPVVHADRPGSGLSSQVTMGERLLQLADEREHAGNSQ